MVKILEFVDRYTSLIILLGGLMILVMFVRTCGMNNDMEKHDEKIETKIEQIDSVLNVTTNKVNEFDLSEETVRLLFEENMWYFLELEELADKQRSIE